MKEILEEQGFTKKENNETYTKEAYVNKEKNLFIILYTRDGLIEVYIRDGVKSKLVTKYNRSMIFRGFIKNKKHFENLLEIIQYDRTERIF